MFCKWCGMESATPDRCSWCNGILAADAKEAKETTETAADAAGLQAEDAGAEALPAASAAEAGKKRVPAPPPGGMRRTPAPPVPPRSLRTETPPVEATPTQRFAAPLTDFSAPTASEEPPAAFMAPTLADAPPVAAASEPTLLGTAAPLSEPTLMGTVAATEAAEPEEEFSGLAAGQAKAVEKTPMPTAENQMFNANAGAPMSKYYPGKTIEETTGIGANEYVPPPVPESAPKPKYNKKKTEPDLHIEWVQPEVSSAAVWGKFAAALAGVLAVCGALALGLKGNILLPLLLANFAMGVLIPVLRVGPWQDEESEDSIFLVLLTLIFGPFVSLTIYGVMSAVKQMTNPAVLGILITAAITRFALGVISGPFTLSMMTPLQSGHFSLAILLLQWGGLVGMIGWVFANFFHKLHE